MQSFPVFEPGFRLTDGSVLNALVRLLNFGNGSQTNFLGLKTFKQPAPIALTTSATLTVAGLINGFYTANQGAAGAATYTLPTVALLLAALPADFAIDDAFDVVLTNISTVAAEDVTIATAAGWTLVGNMTVNSNDAATSWSTGRFRIRRTGAATMTIYRVG